MYKRKSRGGRRRSLFKKCDEFTKKEPSENVSFLSAESTPLQTTLQSVNRKRKLQRPSSSRRKMRYNNIQLPGTSALNDSILNDSNVSNLISAETDNPTNNNKDYQPLDAIKNDLLCQAQGSVDMNDSLCLDQGPVDLNDSLSLTQGVAIDKEDSLCLTQGVVNRNLADDVCDLTVNGESNMLNECIQVESFDKTLTEQNGFPVLDTTLKEQALNNSLTKVNDQISIEQNKSCALYNNTLTEQNECRDIRTTDDTLFAGLNVTEIASSSDETPFYGLPDTVRECLVRNRGVKKFYDWQDECLKLPAVRRRKNLVYSLPTSGGKTLVAEILIMKEILVHHRNVIFVLPYVSIVQEKVRELSPFAVELGFNIEEYAASKGTFPPKKRRKKHSVYIATIEKANAILNSLLELGLEEELGMVVVDELHMIGEGGGRGALLEILLSKIIVKFKHSQIVGMSATLGNIDEVQNFLSAELYTNDFRPVELVEHVKDGDTLYEVLKTKTTEDLLKITRKVSHVQGLPAPCKSQDPDHILTLVLEVIPHHSCLIFCPTKKNCENVALMLAKIMPSEVLEPKKAERITLLSLMQSAINGVCRTLRKTLPYGIAYHHSGLTMDERKLIEEAYAAGVLCLLCCTSTLAAGVNLPAKRVIIRSPYVGNQFMLRSQYKQMIGRAGRAGIDSSGESVLIVQKKDREKCKKLLDGPIGVCKSSLLYEKGKGLRHLILSLLGLKVCTSVGSLEDFLKSTLYYVQLDAEDRDKLSEMVQREYDQLVLLKMVTNEEVVLTSLGHATYKGCMDVDRAPFVYSQLQHSLQGMVLRDELHLLYLATPLDQVEGLFVKWMIYYNQVIKLDEVAIKAAHFIGVTENMLSKKATGKRCNKESFNEFVYKRFFLTLLLFELTKGRSVLQVSETYEVQRGFVQNLLSSAISFTYMLVQFTGELSEFWTLKLLFQALLERLSNTNNLELAPLMELPGVKLVRARQLFKSGYHTLQQLAVADPETLIASIEHMPRKQATLIVASAKMILQEKVEALREKADEMDIEVA